MWFLYNNIAVFAVTIVIASVSWVYGGTRSDRLLPFVPWLILLMTEVIVFFPQKHFDETTYDARDRVWRRMKRDPLVWLCLGLLVLLAIPFANNGLCPICDRLLIAQGVSSDPAVPFLPFCVNRMHHLNVFLWFATAFSCLIATRHCLTHEGKRLVLEMIVWNGFALAIFGFVQIAAGAPGPLWCSLGDGLVASTFFSTFGYPNMGADYFLMIFGLSAALWRYHRDDALESDDRGKAGVDRSKRTRFSRQHYMLIPAAVSFFAVMHTLSRAGIILGTILALLFFAHAFVSFLSRVSKARRFRLGTISLAVLGMIVFFASIAMPEDIQREVDTLDAREVADRVTGRGQYHVRVATELWKDHVLFGCGGWGYKHLCISKMTPEELKQIQMVGGINVHNDYLQFLAEHGLVGFGGLVALVVLLLVPVVSIWKSLAHGAAFLKGKKRPPSPIQLFCLPAPAFYILLTAAATLIHAFGDCPLRSPAVLTLFFVELAAIVGFLPRRNKEG